MSQDSQLLQQIASLAGAINRHKNTQSGYSSGNGGSFRGRGGYSTRGTRGASSRRGAVTRGFLTRGNPNVGRYTRGSGGVNRARGKISKYTNSVQPHKIPTNGIIEIAGVKYKSDSNGMKLTKLSEVETNTLNQLIPKKALINGVPYIRNKQGNLTQKKLKNKSSKSTKPCAEFTKKGMCRYLKELSNNAGICQRGDSCMFVHDPKHVALCRHYLSDECTSKDCKFSHEPTAHNSPLCWYYRRGSCSKDNCKYTHMDISPLADICYPFAYKKYCELGSECKSLHTFSCPEYEREGTCPRGKRCPLEHVKIKRKYPDKLDEEIKKMRETKETKTAERTVEDSNSINYGLLNDLLGSESDDDEENDQDDDGYDTDELEDVIVDLNSTIDDDFVRV